jgi:hypothetical protein
VKKLSILLVLFPLNALAHPGHVEITVMSTLSFLLLSGIATLALHSAVNVAREKLKRS